MTADELASAYLDDELADPGSVEGDADLLERVATFATVRDQAVVPAARAARATTEPRRCLGRELLEHGST